MQLVYDIYSIPDPMAGQSESSDRERVEWANRVKNSRRTMTGTPVLRKKSSASSFRDKMVKHRDIDLNALQSNRKPTK